MSTAESTSIALLNRLKSPHAEMAWQRFVDLYGPLIFYWGRQKGLNATDAADLLQDVLSDLVVRLRTFEYDASQRFRGWLRTIVVNRASNMRRRNELAPQSGQHSSVLLATEDDDHDLLAETQYRCHIAKQTLMLLRNDFGDSTWQAGWMQIVDQRKAADVASELQITVNAAYLAKSRLLSKLSPDRPDNTANAASELSWIESELPAPQTAGQQSHKPPYNRRPLVAPKVAAGLALILVVVVITIRGTDGQRTKIETNESTTTNLNLATGSEVMIEHQPPQYAIGKTPPSEPAIDKADARQSTQRFQPPVAIVPFSASEAKSHQAGWSACLCQPVEITNSIGMKFVLIWEYECRAGTVTEHFWRDDPDLGDGYLNAGDLTGVSETRALRFRPTTSLTDPALRTAPVGSFQPNAFVLHDMAGNLWEWCSDWSSDYQPQDQQDPVGPETARRRASRGAAWASESWNWRSSFRSRSTPTYRCTHLAFRVVLTATAKPPEANK